ncbi:hypothetical protein CAPTEDRAFT_191286 [Capitella teleta]|uniref:RING-type domain-containing protein n=1 Tax=Capitella teleta TaxID=283909 RepID=R7UDJ5_CAPTE|nr:hypothetical protein CAPTEDRAFT_191286 [Capitella teleta]|eukprot:ELU01863.1 hypothetical protein CAPTEDRAFT_191286 [Capitella teleta]
MMTTPPPSPGSTLEQSFSAESDTRCKVTVTPLPCAENANSESNKSLRSKSPGLVSLPPIHLAPPLPPSPSRGTSRTASMPTLNIPMPSTSDTCATKTDRTYITNSFSVSPPSLGNRIPLQKPRSDVIGLINKTPRISRNINNTTILPEITEALACALFEAEDEHASEREAMSIQLTDKDQQLDELVAGNLHLCDSMQEDFWRQEVVHQEEMEMLRNEAVVTQMIQVFEPSDSLEHEATKMKLKEQEELAEIMTTSLQISEVVQEELLMQQAADQEELSLLKEKTMHAENKMKQSVEQQEKMKRTVKDAMESELVCPICHEYFVEATSLNCSHTFCAVCIDIWLQDNFECPQCRQDVDSRVRSRALDNHIDRLMDSVTEEEKEARTELKRQRAEYQPPEYQPPPDGGDDEDEVHDWIDPGDSSDFHDDDD